MVLAKADGRIAVRPPAGAAGTAADRRRSARLQRAIDGILRVTGHGELWSRSVIRRSIDVRNPYVDPLNPVQVELLRRVREQDDPRTRAVVVRQRHRGGDAVQDDTCDVRGATCDVLLVVLRAGLNAQSHHPDNSTPPFALLGGCDHRMGGRACVLRRVLVRRRITAERDAAHLTRSQVHPPRADLHALSH